jgi:sec-independent protein translocase protein TatB
MLDFSWGQLALIAVVALVVIPSKDLPKALRTAGQWARKARAISREFQSSIEQMVREAELDEVKKEIESATRIDVEHEIRNTVDPGGELSAQMNTNLMDETKPSGDVPPSAEGGTSPPATATETASAPSQPAPQSTAASASPNGTPPASPSPHEEPPR